MENSLLNQLYCVYFFRMGKTGEEHKSTKKSSFLACLGAEISKNRLKDGIMRL